MFDPLNHLLEGSVGGVEFGRPFEMHQGLLPFTFFPEVRADDDADSAFLFGGEAKPQQPLVDLDGSIRLADQVEDRSKAFVALGPANRVAVIDAQSYEVSNYVLVGQRVWQLALSPDEKQLFTSNGISNVPNTGCSSKDTPK